MTREERPYTPPRPEPMPCGGRPIFDASSGCAFRCDACFAVIGSVGMPRHCQDLMDRAQKEITS